MKNTVKIIILAIVSIAIAIVTEQMIAATASIFWQKEIILESYARFTWFLAMAAVIEEISKYWAIYFVIKNKFGLQKFKFILASLFLGILWGIFEIGLAVYTNQNYLTEFKTGSPEILFSFGSLIAFHTLTAFLMGILISANAFSGRLKHLKILFFPILIHILFNFLVVQKGPYTNQLVIISLLIPFFIETAILAFNFRKLA